MHSVRISKLESDVIASRQFHKCANKPCTKNLGLTGYACPIWKQHGINKGSFDEAGYHIAYFNKIDVSDVPNKSELNYFRAELKKNENNTIDVFVS